MESTSLDSCIARILTVGPGIAARRVDRLDALKVEIEQQGGQALVLQMDVADKATVEAGVKKLLDTYGAVDVVFNNAGLMPLSNIDDFKTDEWERMVDVNFKGVRTISVIACFRGQAAQCIYV